MSTRPSTEKVLEDTEQDKVHALPVLKYLQRGKNPA